jgi:YVTN family beta-propeller protein
MLCSKIACLLAFSFVFLIALTIVVLPSFGVSSSYAKSNSNENISSISSPTSDKREHRERNLIDADQTSSPSSRSSLSTFAPTPDSSNETTNNEPQPGTIIVTKRVINEGGGSAKPSDFTITVDGNNPTPSSFDGSSSGTTVQMFEGRYRVTESGSTSNYDATLSRGCSGNIREGEAKTCMITNTYSVTPPPITTGEIVVTKRVINEGGGSAKPSDFTITVDGNNPTPSSFDGSSSGTTVTLNPGSYSVTENLLSDYTSSMSGGCTGTVSAGQTKNCIITNKYQPTERTAQLVVTENVNNNNKDNSDLTVKPSAFTITVHGNNPLPRSFPGKSGEGVVVNLYPGRYSITEEEVNGYTADYSDGCQGTIHAEEAKACIITNEEDIIPPSPLPPQLLPEIETITGFSAPYGIALNPGNGLVYVSNYGQFNTTGTVSVINGTTNTIVGNIHVGKNPQAIVYNPANGFLYVANTLSNTLSIINGTSNFLVGSIPVGDFPGKNPTGIAANSINNTVYVTNMGANTVSVINGTSNVVVENVTLNTSEGAGRGFFSPAGIAYDSDNGNLYVANRGLDTVSVINGTSNSLIDEIPIDGVAPSGIVYNAANNYIYVTSTGSNKVSVINGTTNAVVEDIPVGLGPNGVAYDQRDGNIYVANSINGTISIINGLTNTVTGTVILGTNNTPNGVLYNPNNDSWFVSNTNSSTVYVIKNQ